MIDDFHYFPELQEFINDNTNSIEKWDIMVYFSRSPESRENISSLMALTGKSEEAIKKAVDDFAEKRILSIRWTNHKKEPYYYISADYQDILKKLRTGLDDRQCRFRLMMLALDRIRSHQVSLSKEKP